MNTREKHTDAQIQLAVDYIAKHYTCVTHPEDKDFGLFVSYDQIEKKVAALSDEERAARISRKTQYLENFKTALRNYLQNSNPWCSGVVSDYGVDNMQILDAIKGTNVNFAGGFWSVSLSQDGKVYFTNAKYGKKKEIQLTAAKETSNLPEQKM